MIREAAYVLAYGAILLAAAALVQWATGLFGPWLILGSLTCEVGILKYRQRQRHRSTTGTQHPTTHGSGRG